MSAHPSPTIAKSNLIAAIQMAVLLARAALGILKIAIYVMVSIFFYNICCINLNLFQTSMNAQHPQIPTIVMIMLYAQIRRAVLRAPVMRVILEMARIVQVSNHY